MLNELLKKTMQKTNMQEEWAKYQLKSLPPKSHMRAHSRSREEDRISETKNKYKLDGTFNSNATRPDIIL